MSTTNTIGNWVTTWDRSGRLIQVYDPTSIKHVGSLDRTDWTDNKPRKIHSN